MLVQKLGLAIPNALHLHNVKLGNLVVKPTHLHNKDWVDPSTHITTDTATPVDDNNDFFYDNVDGVDKDAPTEPSIMHGGGSHTYMAFVDVSALWTDIIPTASSLVFSPTYYLHLRWTHGCFPRGPSRRSIVYCK